MKTMDKKLMQSMKIFDTLTIEDLRLILAIADEGSLTKGARRMGMSQSNASYALKKIQNVFQSNLFVRKGRILVPAEYGWHVYRQIQSMLAEFKKVTTHPKFDCKSYFTLHFAATEYEATTILPQIMQLLKRHAPKAQVKIIALNVPNMLKQVEEVDFSFVSSDISSKKTEVMQVLTDSNITFFDSNMRGAPKTLSQFVQAKHAIVSFGGSGKTKIDDILAQQGLKREIALSVFGFTALAALMRHTDLIATLPASFANSLFSAFDNCHCPLQLQTMPLFMCWDATKAENGKLRWFRKLVADNRFDVTKLDYGRLR